MTERYAPLPNLAQIYPGAPTGLTENEKDQQYDIPRQLYQPLAGQSSTHNENDINSFFNPNKQRNPSNFWAQTSSPGDHTIFKWQKGEPLPYTYDPHKGNPMLDTEMEDKHNFKIGGTNEWYPGGPRSYAQASDNIDSHMDEMGVPLPFTYDPNKGQPLYDEVMHDGHDFKVRAQNSLAQAPGDTSIFKWQGGEPLPHTYDPDRGQPMLDTEMKDTHDIKRVYKPRLV